MKLNKFNLFFLNVTFKKDWNVSGKSTRGLTVTMFSIVFPSDAKSY